MKLPLEWMVGACLASALIGCGTDRTAATLTQPRDAANVSPEMLDRALKSLHSQDAKLQISGLRFLESFPELKQKHVARIEEIAHHSKDAKARAQAEKVLKI